MPEYGIILACDSWLRYKEATTSRRAYDCALHPDLFDRFQDALLTMIPINTLPVVEPKHKGGFFYRGVEFFPDANGLVAF